MDNLEIVQNGLAPLLHQTQRMRSLVRPFRKVRNILKPNRIMLAASAMVGLGTRARVTNYWPGHGGFVVWRLLILKMLDAGGWRASVCTVRARTLYSIELQGQKVSCPAACIVTQANSLQRRLQYALNPRC